MNDPLLSSITTTHDELRAHIAAAAEAVRANAERQEIVRKVDAAIISLCQHQSAVCRSLIPLAKRHLRPGDTSVRDYVRQIRRVENAASLAKARLYGAAQARGSSWPQIWSHLTAEIDKLAVIEASVVKDLSSHLDETGREQAATLLARLESRSPTRPHPNSPHTGRLAHLTRAWWARADRIWDAAEGRSVSRRAS